MIEPKIGKFGLKDMTILPPKKGVCPICGTAHEACLPHNKDSLYYQYSFMQQHDRWPTWEDAMAHCSEDIRTQCTEILINLGAMEAKR